MIVLNVSYDIKPEAEAKDFYEALMKARIPEQCQQEKGNIRYHYYYPADGSHTLLLLEIWENEACLQAHQKTPHFLQITSIKEPYVAHTRLVRSETA